MCRSSPLSGKSDNSTDCYFSFLDSPSSLADLEANLARTMNHLAQNAKDLEVHVVKGLSLIFSTIDSHYKLLLFDINK